MVVDASTVRSLVSRAVVSDRVNQWANLFNEVGSLAVREGLIHHESETRGEPWYSLIVECTWDLFRSGVLCPLHPDQNMVFLRPTAYGRRVLEDDRPSPYDPDGYIASLQRRVPTLDEVTLLYIVEAMDSLRADNHIAATMMAGVAVENSLVLLAETMVAHLPEKEAKNLQKTLVGKRQASVLLTEIRKRLDVRKGDLPRRMADHYDGFLSGIATVVRLARNDAGHPSGTRFDRDDTFPLLMLLPTYLALVFDLIEWFDQSAS